jgi:hypothetical protein
MLTKFTFQYQELDPQGWSRDRNEQTTLSSFVGRPNRSKSNSTRAGPSNGNQNAQYLQLARTEAVNGNTVGAENYCQHARLDVATPPDHTA